MTPGGTNFTNFLENQIDQLECMPSYTETCGHLLLVYLAIDPILLV